MISFFPWIKKEKRYSWFVSAQLHRLELLSMKGKWAGEELILHEISSLGSSTRTSEQQLRVLLGLKVGLPSGSGCPCCKR